MKVKNRSLIRPLFMFSAAAALLFSALSSQADDERGVVIVTGGIGGEYEILGVVHGKDVKDLDDVNASLRKQAAKMGADYVINTEYFEFQAQLHAVGTAVRLKEEEDAAAGGVDESDTPEKPAEEGLE